jgi:dTDP-4-dehydrorhamnose 3,5-epimerase
MLFTKTGCVLVPRSVCKDDRGYFTEVFKSSTSGLDFIPAQVNLSFSEKNVVRGIHFQSGKYAQRKYIHIVDGEVIDVVVDLDVNSNTYGQMEFFTLTPESFNLCIPATHGHGFWAVKPTYFLYLCDRPYNKASERGINPLDSYFNFPWHAVDKDSLNVSPKDRGLPHFNALSTH